MQYQNILEILIKHVSFVLETEMCSNDHNKNKIS